MPGPLASEDDGLRSLILSHSMRSLDPFAGGGMKRCAGRPYESVGCWEGVLWFERAAAAAVRMGHDWIIVALPMLTRGAFSKSRGFRI